MSLTTIEIAGRLVGEGQPCYVIAEAGVNHNGDPALAKRLIDIAADAGADAVKFQKRTPSEILTAEALRRPYNVPTSLGATYGEHREKLELSAESFRMLLDHAEDARHHPAGERLGHRAASTSSTSSASRPTRSPRRTAPTCRWSSTSRRQGKPVLLSTGMSELSEVDEAVDDDPPPHRSACACSSAPRPTRPTTISSTCA